MAEEISDAVEREEKEMEKRKPGLLSGILHSGLALGATYLSYGLVGFGGPLTGLGFAGGSALLNLMGKKQDKKSKGVVGVIRDYSIGSLMGILGVGMWSAAATYMPDPWVRGIVGGIFGNAIWSTAYIGTNHIYKHGPAGLVNAYKKDWSELTKKSIFWMGIPVGLTMNGYLGGYPGIVGVDVGFRAIAGLVSGRQSAKAEPEKDYQPVPGAVPQPT